jgi:hypothetical protein
MAFCRMSQSQLCALSLRPHFGPTNEFRDAARLTNGLFLYEFTTVGTETAQLNAKPLKFGRSWRIRTADQAQC